MQDAGLCTLRSQLLMALHDRKDVELCRTEHCHKLAWIIDACLRDHVMDERRLRELNGFFQLYDNIANKGNLRVLSCGPCPRVLPPGGRLPALLNCLIFGFLMRKQTASASPS